MLALKAKSPVNKKTKDIVAEVATMRKEIDFIRLLTRFSILCGLLPVAIDFKDYPSGYCSFFSFNNKSSKFGEFREFF